MRRVDEIQGAALLVSAADFKSMVTFPVLVCRMVEEGELERRRPSAKPGDPFGGTTLLHKDAGGRARPIAAERWLAIKRNEEGFGRECLFVGRKRACDVFINDYTVSAVHAYMHRDPRSGRIDLEDAQSTNFTWVNGRQLYPGTKRMLIDGDQVRFGRMVFTYFTTLGFHAYLTAA